MPNHSKTAVLLLNVGTPNSPKVSDVRKYLSQFLNDKRVIDLPWLGRKILVNLIIVPFRSPKSAKLYRRLWTDKGSPLLYHTKSLVNKLNAKNDDTTRYFFAMRYQNPSIDETLDEIKRKGFERITVLPLFPQYASSTNATAIEAVYNKVNTWQVIPQIKTINQFYDHPIFIQTFANRIKAYQPEEYDHMVFSYHGLPMRQVQKIHPDNPCSLCNCELDMPKYGHYCYKATAYHTSRLLADELGLDEDDYTVSFQSRLSKNWLKPFTDETLKDLAQSGRKKILIAAPSFVTDCLETTLELGYEYKELFTKQGGEQLTLVESLNDSDSWVEALRKITMEQASLLMQSRGDFESPRG